MGVVRLLLGAAFAAWVAVAAVASVPDAAARTEQGPPAAGARTTKDGVYTTTQAEAGKAVFEKVCAACHGFKPSAKSANNPDLAGEMFLANWIGKSVRDLQSLILMTMPNDGSATLEEPQVVEVVAYILEQNGFVAGKAPLVAGPPAATIAIVK